MATGRTLPKFARTYVDGYDWSGYVNEVGSLNWESEEIVFPPTQTDEGIGAYPGMPTLRFGPIKGIFHTDTAGFHELASGKGVTRNVMLPWGIRGTPAAGDPVYAYQFIQLGYRAVGSGGASLVEIPMGLPDASALLNYNKPWGTLLHAKGAETAVNTAIGIDDYGAATAFGGFLAYQLFSSNGTVTIKVQDAATNLNASFADLSGATSGSITAASAPKSGLVQIGHTDTVRRYLRWQIVFGTATTATFALAFIRALRAGD